MPLNLSIRNVSCCESTDRFHAADLQVLHRRRSMASDLSYRCTLSKNHSDDSPKSGAASEISAARPRLGAVADSATQERADAMLEET